jgi:pyridoxamine 5'-phosphate oxidase
VTDTRDRPLRRRDLESDPLAQFEAWFEEARAAGAPMPEAAAVATAGEDGQPSARMVLVKRFDERGFVFHTGYDSRKGRELAANPRAALLFYWHAVGRQVRIEGGVERVARQESAEYFRTRPPGGQLGAAASPQSEVVASREELEARYDELAQRHRDDPVPMPESWGGFRVIPERYEFWQHRDNRMHDRFRYRREAGAWLVERLAP